MCFDWLWSYAYHKIPLYHKKGQALKEVPLNVQRSEKRSLKIYFDICNITDWYINQLHEIEYTVTKQQKGIQKRVCFSEIQ